MGCFPKVLLVMYFEDPLFSISCRKTAIDSFMLISFPLIHIHLCETKCVTVGSLEGKQVTAVTGKLPRAGGSYL
jgi:hypothetical protein